MSGVLPVHHKADQRLAGVDRERDDVGSTEALAMESMLSATNASWPGCSFKSTTAQRLSRVSGRNVTVIGRPPFRRLIWRCWPSDPRPRILPPRHSGGSEHEHDHPLGYTLPSNSTPIDDTAAHARFWRISMDADRFDALTRSLTGAGASRRQVLTGVGGSTLATLATVLGGARRLGRPTSAVAMSGSAARTRASAAPVGARMGGAGPTSGAVHGRQGLLCDRGI